MFKSKKSKPLSFLDAVIDLIPPKPEPSHRKRNGLIVVGIGAASALAAAALNKKGSEQ